MLAIDHTKLGTTARARGFGFKQIDLLVTDLSPSDPHLDSYRELVDLA